MNCHRYPRYLLRLCELERIERERRNVERRIRLARFPQTKSFDTFDFTSQPSLNKALVLKLARCQWIDQRQNCIALGNPVNPPATRHWPLRVNERNHQYTDEKNCECGALLTELKRPFGYRLLNV